MTPRLHGPRGGPRSCPSLPLLETPLQRAWAGALESSSIAVILAAEVRSALGLSARSQGSRFWQSEHANPPRWPPLQQDCEGPRQRAGVASSGGHSSPAPVDTPEEREAAGLVAGRPQALGASGFLGVCGLHGAEHPEPRLGRQPTNGVTTPTEGRLAGAWAVTSHCLEGGLSPRGGHPNPWTVSPSFLSASSHPPGKSKRTNSEGGCPNA